MSTITDSGDEVLAAGWGGGGGRGAACRAVVATPRTLSGSHGHGVAAGRSSTAALYRRCVAA